MSDINDQGPQNVAQAEAEALRALEAGAWRVWQAGSGPLPAAYARWCAAEIELATAALRERIEAAEAEHEDSVVRTNRALRERAEKAEAERDRYKREVMSYEEREAACCPEDVGFEEVIASLRKRAEAAEAEVARLRGLLEAKPYTPRVGDAFTWDGRHFIFAGPAAALLRRLDAEATGGPWIVDGLRDGYVTGVDCNVCDQPGPAYDGYRAWPANARAICTTRNLLPLLAGLVDAVGLWLHTESDTRDGAIADDVLIEAYRALNAAAAKEVK